MIAVLDGRREVVVIGRADEEFSEPIAACDFGRQYVVGRALLPIDCSLQHEAFKLHRLVSCRNNICLCPTPLANSLTQINAPSAIIS